MTVWSPETFERAAGEIHGVGRLNDAVFPSVRRPPLEDLDLPHRAWVCCHWCRETVNARDLPVHREECVLHRGRAA